jgi:hypothetical protein
MRRRAGSDRGGAHPGSMWPGEALGGAGMPGGVRGWGSHVGGWVGGLSCAEVVGNMPTHHLVGSGRSAPRPAAAYHLNSLTW